MVGRKMGHTQLSGGKRLMISSSIHFLWQLIQRSGVLEECAKKVCKDLFSNLRIQATNSYLKDPSVDVNYFKVHSSTFLTLEQYAEVSDSLLILSFLTNCESC
jgi:hypothetical protein